MLSPADRELVMRDPALPGLATVLDPEAFVDAIHAAVGGPRREPGRISYVRYKPGISCLVGHQLTLSGQVVTVSGTALRLDANEKLAKAKQWSDARADGESKPIVLADRAIIVFSFPNDVELNALPLLANADARPRLLEKLLPTRAELWHASFVAIRYKPERRFVARLDVNGEPRAVLKIYTRAGFPAADLNAKVFASRQTLRSPDRLGRSQRHHVLALEWLTGRLLLDLLSESGFVPERMKPVGVALAALHGQRARRLIPRPVDVQASALNSAASWLAHVCPSLTKPARKLAERLSGRLSELPVADSAVHGDFYSKQVLLGDGPVAIIDFDEAFRGDPAYDLGTFLAHLQRDSIRGLLPNIRIDPVQAALIDGYESTGRRTNAAAVAVHAAAGLLRLAPHPFRNREPNWPDATAELLERAEALIHRAGNVQRGQAVPV